MRHPERFDGRELLVRDRQSDVVTATTTKVVASMCVFTRTGC